MGEVIHHPTDYSSVLTKCSSMPFREMNSQRRACFAQPEIDTGLCALTQAVIGAIKGNPDGRTGCVFRPRSPER